MRSMPDKHYDLAICDPDYGLDDKISSGGTWAAKYSKGDGSLGGKPDLSYFTELFRISKNQIVWGGNYFSLPPTRGFIVWDKKARMETLADCEYAWTSFDRNAKIYQRVRNTSEKRIHITQKPIHLYRWLLRNYAEPGQKIFDSHGGSMSHVIAAIKEGFDVDVCEINHTFYEKSKKRILNFSAQYDMFSKQPIINFITTPTI